MRREAKSGRDEMKKEREGTRKKEERRRQIENDGKKRRREEEKKRKRLFPPCDFVTGALMTSLIRLHRVSSGSFLTFLT